jgi:hypothetical protein
LTSHFSFPSRSISVCSWPFVSPLKNQLVLARSSPSTRRSWEPLHHLVSLLPSFPQVANDYWQQKKKAMVSLLPKTRLPTTEETKENDFIMLSLYFILVQMVGFELVLNCSPCFSYFNSIYIFLCMHFSQQCKKLLTIENTKWLSDPFTFQ